MSLRNTLSRIRTNWIVLFAAGIVMLLMVVAYMLFTQQLHAPFRNSEMLMWKELASLHMADSAPDNGHFHDGAGLDNLPEITGTYIIPRTTIGEERSKLGAILEAHGYRDIQQGYPQNIQLTPNTSDFMGNKDRFAIMIHLGSETFGNGIAGTYRPTQDSDAITSFTFDIYDHGDSTH
ncbi:MAG TPA: hypothetical protein VLF64_00815 [Candidatus Saccharimonadales bacterium]|nr:hypothetical protein [Candidatus Saccharimonadales bacterium]